MGLLSTLPNPESALRCPWVPQLASSSSCHHGHSPGCGGCPGLETSPTWRDTRHVSTSPSKFYGIACITLHGSHIRWLLRPHSQKASPQAAQGEAQQENALTALPVLPLPHVPVCLSVSKGGTFLQPGWSSASIIVTTQHVYNHTESVRTRHSCTRVNPVLESPPQRDGNEVLSSMWSPMKRAACSPLRCRPAPQDLQGSSIGPLPCMWTALQTPRGWDLWVYWPTRGQEAGELHKAHKVPLAQAYLLRHSRAVATASCSHRVIYATAFLAAASLATMLTSHANICQNASLLYGKKARQFEAN